MKWKKVSIHEITNNLDSRRIPLNASQRAEIEQFGLYPYIGANNILTYVDEFIFDEEILCIAEDGGSWGANEQCAFIVNEKCWVNNHAHVLSAKPNLALKYLMYFLNWADLSLIITGATRGKLTKKALSNYKIPLPPLPEQRRIAAILDAADALRRHDKALIERYDALIQSVFHEMFGDPVKNEKYKVSKLASVATFIDYRGKSPNKSDAGIPLLTAKNIKSGFISTEPKEFIFASEYESWMTRGFPSAGDVLFTTEAPLGNAAILPKFEKVAIAQRIICLKPGEEISSDFLLYYILNSRFQGELLRRATGSTAKGIRSKELSKIEILIPPISSQKKFSKYISAINSQKAQAQQSLSQSEALFGSLMQKAFKGEL